MTDVSDIQMREGEMSQVQAPAAAVDVSRVDTENYRSVWMYLKELEFRQGFVDITVNGVPVHTRYAEAGDPDLALSALARLRLIAAALPEPHRQRGLRRLGRAVDGERRHVVHQRDLSRRNGAVGHGLPVAGRLRLGAHG